MSVRSKQSGQKSDRLSEVLFAGLSIRDSVADPINSYSSSGSSGSSSSSSSSSPTEPSPPSQPSPVPQRSFQSEVLLEVPLVGQVPDVSATTLRAIGKRMVRDGVVVTTIKNSETLLSTRADGGSLEYAKDWNQVGRLAMLRGKYVGGGSFNSAYKFNTSLIKARRIQGIEDLLPPTDLVLRQSNEGTKMRSVVLELIISAYAAHHKFGPHIYAVWTVPDADAFNFTDDDYDDGTTDDFKVGVNYISEKWIGDLYDPLAAKSIEPNVFAARFSNLLRRSIDHGFWQVDSKPDNVLYRYGDAGPGDAGPGDADLELCWTDFDPKYCSIFPPSVNSRIGVCSALVHAASFMGYVSCVSGTDVFDYYRGAVKEALVQEFQIDTVSVDDICKWIDKFDPMLDDPPDRPDQTEEEELALYQAKLEVSRLLLPQLRNYIGDSEYEPGARCILVKSEKPSFTQMLDFALLKVGEADVERLGQRVPMLFKRPRM